MTEYYVERTGNMLVYHPVKDNTPKETPELETTPPNAWLRNVKV